MRAYAVLIQYTVLLFALSLVFVSNAFADDCRDLSNNASWNAGMTKMNNQMKANQWDEALKTGESLYTICERSPMLNYLMGSVYKEQGNESKALYYIQRATLYTEEFAVKGKNIRRNKSRCFIILLACECKITK